jgi:hypothetical protein
MKMTIAFDPILHLTTIVLDGPITGPMPQMIFDCDPLKYAEEFDALEKFMVEQQMTPREIINTWTLLKRAISDSDEGFSESS